jgi:hypothetical protein
LEKRDSCGNARPVDDSPWRPQTGGRRLPKARMPKPQSGYSLLIPLCLFPLSYSNGENGPAPKRCAAAKPEIKLRGTCSLDEPERKNRKKIKKC